jgi:hypothetical protein
MPALLAPPLPPGCPWSGFTPPNVNWCEEELCALVVNPADTWSNLAYLGFGVWMWREARGGGRADLARFGPASVAVGVFSFVYHASYTWLLQFFDFVGMFLFCFLVIAANARRLGWVAPRRETALYLAGVGAFSALVPVLFYAGVPIQGLVFLLILFAIAQELALRRRAPRAGGYRWYALALALMAAASAFSALDVTRAWCDPADHVLQGHALWHVLSAASLAALFVFYRGLASPVAAPS